MQQTLYRKYRPQKFSSVVGQEHIKITLLNELKRKQLAHAYLFCGPRGIGKTSLARLFAKSVNCLNPVNGEACDTCLHCRLIQEEKTMDILEIDAASHTGVDNVRENIIQQARLQPGKLTYKVFIIDEVHMLSISAFNALLKTLEEPPSQTIFILATTELHKLPATIVSRCQRFDFKKIPFPAMINKLQEICAQEGVEVELTVLTRIAQHAEGCLRDAESLLSQVLTLDEKKITQELAELVMPHTDLVILVDFFEKLVLKNTREALAQLNQLAEEGMDLIDFGQRLLEFLRKILLYKIQGRLTELDYLDLDEKNLTRVQQSLEKITAQELKQLIEVFLVRIPELKNTPILSLPLELALVEWCLGAAEKKTENYKLTPLEHRPLTLNSAPKLTAANAAPNAKIDEAAPLFMEIKNKWTEFLGSVRKVNSSLAVALGVANLVGLQEKNILVLGFKYKFHSERLMQHAQCTQVELLLRDFYGTELKLQCQISDKFSDVPLQNAIKSDNIEAPNSEDTKDVWDLAANVFQVAE